MLILLTKPLTLLKIFLSLLCSIFILTSFSSFAQHSLTVKIKGIRNNKGTINFGVFNNANGFLKEGKALKTQKLTVKNGEATVVLSSLPKGIYAFSLFHDSNSDGKCNTNLVGIPTEGYAFSNNMRPKLAAPSFKDCSFNLSSNTSVEVRMIN